MYVCYRLLAVGRNQQVEENKHTHTRARAHTPTHTYTHTHTRIHTHAYTYKQQNKILQTIDVHNILSPSDE